MDKKTTFLFIEHMNTFNGHIVLIYVIINQIQHVEVL